MVNAAVPVLIDKAGAQNEGTRATAIDTLGNIGSEAEEAEPVIIEALKDICPKVRANAAHALGTMGANGSRSTALVVGTHGPELVACNHRTT